MQLVFFVTIKTAISLALALCYLVSDIRLRSRIRVSHAPRVSFSTSSTYNLEARVIYY